MPSSSLKPFLVPLVVGIGAAWFLTDGDAVGGSGPIGQAVLGPPDDVSREYAKQLLETQPHKAGEMMIATREMYACLFDQGYFQQGLGSYRLSDMGSQHFSKMYAFPPALFPAYDVPSINVHVSGVRTMQNGAKLIEYTGTDSYDSACFRFTASVPRKAIAERYDDGWRVKRVVELRR